MISFEIKKYFFNIRKEEGGVCYTVVRSFFVVFDLLIYL